MPTTPRDLRWDWPEVAGYFKDNDPELVTALYVLALEGCGGNRRNAIRLFRILWENRIRSVADFDCSRLLNLMQMKGVGKVFGKALAEMFRARLVYLYGRKDIPISIEEVMD